MPARASVLVWVSAGGHRLGEQPFLPRHVGDAADRAKNHRRLTIGALSATVSASSTALSNASPSPTR